MRKSKSLILILFISLFILGCRNNDESETTIIGTWKLTAQLMDPGDGSGKFQPVESNKTVTFFDNGTYSSNGSFCGLSIESNETTTGTYSYSDTEKSLTPTCTYEVGRLQLNIEDNKLIMSNFGCIESCQQKFVKIK